MFKVGDRVRCDGTYEGVVLEEKYDCVTVNLDKKPRVQSYPKVADWHHTRVTLVRPGYMLSDPIFSLEEITNA